MVDHNYGEISISSTKAGSIFSIVIMSEFRVEKIVISTIGKTRPHSITIMKENTLAFHLFANG